MFEYLDATLTPVIQASVREHLRHCQACSKVFDEEQRFSGSLSTLLEQQTRSLQIRPGLQEKVILRARQRSRPAIIRFHAIPTGPATCWALAAAACLLIASITAFLIWKHPTVDISSPLRSAMQLPVASLPAKPAIPASTLQTAEQHWTEPSQSSLDAKWAKRQAQSAADLETALATVKSRQESFFASIAARQRQYITRPAKQLNPSAAALEAAMAEIKTRQVERFAHIEAAQQGYFQEIAWQGTRPNQSAADLEAAMAKNKARQAEHFSRIKATQQSLAEKIRALQKPVTSS